MILKPEKNVLPVRNHPLTKNLIGCWLFNDTPSLLGKTHNYGNNYYGNVGDTSNGFLTGNVYVASGKFGPALSFDGTGDYVRVWGVSGKCGLIGYPFTILVWANADGVPPGVYGTAFCLSRFGVTDQYIWIRYSNDSVGWQYVGRNTTVSTIYQNFQSRGWQHLVVVMHSATKQEFYIDGRLIGTSTTSVPWTNEFNNICFGALASNSSYTSSLNGLIDNISLYSRALTLSEIQQLYRDPFCMFRRKPTELWSAGMGGSAPPAGTNMKINIGGVWKDVDSLKINIGGVWKDVISVKQNISGEWKIVY